MHVLKKARALKEKAKKESADLVVFSEAFIPGFPTWVHLHAPIVQNNLFKKLVESSIEIPSPAFKDSYEDFYIDSKRAKQGFDGLIRINDNVKLLKIDIQQK